MTPLFPGYLRPVIAVIQVDDVEDTVGFWTSTPWLWHEVVFCGKCGDVWARIRYYQQQPQEHFRWGSVQQPCQRCGGGSVLDLEPWFRRDYRYEIEWGAKLALREYNLLLELRPV